MPLLLSLTRSAGEIQAWVCAGVTVLPAVLLAHWYNFVETRPNIQNSKSPTSTSTSVSGKTKIQSRIIWRPTQLVAGAYTTLSG